MSKSFNINELQLKYLELETLLDITNELNSFDQVSLLLQEILIKSCGVLNASSGLILIESQNTDLLEVEADFNIDTSIVKGLIFNKKKGFIQQIINNRTVLLIDNHADPILAKIQGSHAIIAPLFDKKNLVGLIILFDKETRQGVVPFHESDVNMLSAIASQASIAYNNIKLIENIKEAKTFNDNVMQSIVTGVFTTNLMGEVNHINRAALQILNNQFEEVIGNHYEYILEQNIHLIQMISDCEAQMETIVASQIALNSNGKTTMVNISVAPLLNDINEPIGSVVAMEDLSNLDKLKSTFKKYVSQQIVDQILENDELLTLGGREQEITVLFSDIRGFTSMSESMDPAEVVQTLNEYFDLMIEIVFKYNGTLDKIIGDALMVIYGTPNSKEDDTENAIKTAIEMQEALIDFNQKRVINGQLPIRIGIGINRGKAISGNIGSKQQMNYTVIGDSVNLASRLCSVAKADEIIISESVWKEVAHSKKFSSKKQAPVKVKGKAKAIEIREIIFQSMELYNVGLFNHIENYLISHLPEHLTYHSIHHIRDVVMKVKEIGKLENINDVEIFELELAAWLHDIGYIWEPERHEERGCEFVKVIGPNLGLSKITINRICGMIMATKIPQNPTTQLEEIICDADLDYLGREDYTINAEKLFKEINVYKKIDISQWLQVQLSFLKNHQYFTLTNKKRRELGKNKIIKIIEDQLNNL